MRQGFDQGAGKLGAQGGRPDQGHLSPKHVPQLRDGVQVEIIWGINKPQFSLVSGTTHTDIQIRLREAGTEKIITDTAEERLIFPQELRLLADMTRNLKIVGWYDNEWAYTNRLVEMAQYICK